MKDSDKLDLLDFAKDHVDRFGSVPCEFETRTGEMVPYEFIWEVTGHLVNPLYQFKELGMQASYHYADDTCKEWGLGDKAKHQALKIFDGNTALQPELRKIAADFLWSLEIDRPTRLPPAHS